jgi:hypothetical protein
MSDRPVSALKADPFANGAEHETPVHTLSGLAKKLDEMAADQLEILGAVRDLDKRMTEDVGKLRRAVAARHHPIAVWGVVLGVGIGAGSGAIMAALALWRALSGLP